jgi:hypothetical protein
MSTKHSESIGVIVRVRPEAPGDTVDDGGEQPAVAQLDGCSLALFHPSADAGESDAAGAPLSRFSGRRRGWSGGDPLLPDSS